jgi:hypothetical protein
LKKGNIKQNINNINTYIKRIKNAQPVVNSENNNYNNNYNNNNDSRFSEKYTTNRNIKNSKREEFNQLKLNNSADSIRSASRFDYELEKKTKTILRKNIVGRYKRSPYLKSFENL